MMISFLLALSLSSGLSLSFGIGVGSGQNDVVSQARAHLQAGRAGQAVKILREYLGEDPNHDVARCLLGHGLRATGEFDEALSIYRQLIKEESLLAEAWFGIACVSSIRKESDDGMKALGRAVKAGFVNRNRLMNDAALAHLRNHEDFSGLLPPQLDGNDLFLEDAVVLYTLVGERAGDEFGWVARNVGDLDEDGVDDFAATSPSFNNGAGKVYVYSSAKGKLLFEKVGQPGERLGNAVAPAGDVDGDDVPDVIAGAPNGKGRAYVYSGASGKTILTLESKVGGESFGLKVCGAGDLDDDGHADLMVGVPNADDVATDAGRVDLFSGSSGELLDSIQGEHAGENLGSAVDAVRDDEPRLLAIGAMSYKNQGRAYIYEWMDGEVVLAFTIDPESKSRNLGQYFVSILGDVDGDDVPDVYASDWNNMDGGPARGKVYVHSGFNGERLLTVQGDRAGEGFGTSPSDAGDVDGDGHADLIVGAWQNGEAAPSGGKCYLISGKTSKALKTWTCREPGDTFGFDATGLGDVDGDGTYDFLLTSAWSTSRGIRTGRVFVVSSGISRER